MCGRETLSGGKAEILAFADHSHARKTYIRHYKKGETLKSMTEPLLNHSMVIVQKAPKVA